MSREYCHFCNTEFICGRACRTEAHRDRCGEWKLLQDAAYSEWAGKNSIARYLDAAQPVNPRSST